MSDFVIRLGDSNSLIPEFNQANSVHAVITDPPYGINFMSHGWDKVLPKKEIWKACFEALRPGGFCLAFGHTRLYHRLCVDLEDAGFIIKDCLCWVYASGFPHSYNISKAIDDIAGVERSVLHKQVHPILKNKPRVKSRAYLSDTLDSDEDIESLDDTAPVTDDAKNWDGWGTQLKPAWEPIVLAQKPIDGTYAENIVKYHVGALNIDACRIPYASDEDRQSLETFMNFQSKEAGDPRFFSANAGGKKQVNVHPLGRWPANIMWLDPLFADYDRFFMIPKPSKAEKRYYNNHDTVKPVRLIEHLISLVSPKPSVVNENVIILDPFAGSGTTGVACRRLGRTFHGCEIDAVSFETMQKRLSEKVGRPGDLDIFEI